MPQVTLVPSGQDFTAERDEPVLAAALRAGLNLPHSCKGGHCSSCLARIVSGTIAYPGERPVGITDDEARGGYALLCQARALTDLRVEAREMRPAPEVDVRSLPCRIERKVALAPDVMAVFLRLPAVEALHHRAGQYLDIMLSEGRRRRFSIASAPADGPLVELHVRRASTSGFTAQLFDVLRPGALLRIEGPLGQFWLRAESARPALMVGGGTGYAPLRAMLRQMIATGDRRAVTLYWGARDLDGLYEDAWLRDLELTRPGFRYCPVLSEPPQIAANARSGLVHEVVLADHPDLSAFEVYASGPPTMIETIRERFSAAGLPREQLHFDSFDYAPDTMAKMSAASSGP